MLRKALTSSLVLALVASAPAHAQVSLNTDASWSSCRVLLTGVVPCTTGAGTVVVASPLPNGWQPGPWIRAEGGNPLPTVVGENPSWQYGFSTTFNATAGAATISISRFQLDNYFKSSSTSNGTTALAAAGFFLNGSAIAFGAGDWLTAAGAPSDPNAENWTKVFAIDLNVTLANGVNTFEVRTTGNGNNDGMALQGRVSRGGGSVVPEPTSLALMAVGFMGLGVASRRRRTA